MLLIVILPLKTGIRIKNKNKITIKSSQRMGADLIRGSLEASAAAAITMRKLELPSPDRGACSPYWYANGGCGTFAETEILAVAA